MDKKKIVGLFLLSLFIHLKSFSTTHIITNSEFLFTPNDITAHVGDTVMFAISPVHSAIEVSLATWNDNSNVSNGGFKVPLGGGMVILSEVKTYYYVCGEHYSLGMKGKITVTAVSELSSTTDQTLEWEKIPVQTAASTTFKIKLPEGKTDRVKILSAAGLNVYERENLSANEKIDLTGFIPGIYSVEIERAGKLEKKNIVISK